MDAFSIVPVFDHAPPDHDYAPGAAVVGYGRHVSFHRRIRDSHVAILTFPAGYNYFNYGLRSHRAVVEEFLADHAAPPLVTASSRSRVRAYLAAETRCTADILVENNNFGSFNYHGFTRARGVRPAPTPPVASEIVLGGALFAAGRAWNPAPESDAATVDRDAAGRLRLRNIDRDTVVRLVNSNCPG